jgi:hypothetical protein
MPLPSHASPKASLSVLACTGNARKHSQAYTLRKNIRKHARCRFAGQRLSRQPTRQRYSHLSGVVCRWAVVTDVPFAVAIGISLQTSVHAHTTDKAVCSEVLKHRTNNDASNASSRVQSILLVPATTGTE